MPYELAIEKKDGYLLATVYGTRSFETVLAITEEILSTSRKEKTGKALVDLCGLKGQFDTLEAFTIPDHYFPKLKYRNALTRCAIIDLEEYKERVRFFEDVAVNRGFFLRFFTDPEKALNWLKS